MVDYRFKNKKIEIQFPIFQTELNVLRKADGSIEKESFFGRYGVFFFSAYLDEIESVSLRDSDWKSLEERGLINKRIVEGNPIDFLKMLVQKVENYRRDKKNKSKYL